MLIDHEFQVGQRVQLTHWFDGLPVGSCGIVQGVFLSVPMYDVLFDKSHHSRLMHLSYLLPANEQPNLQEGAPL
jgi:hypothetical protein